MKHLNQNTLFIAVFALFFGFSLAHWGIEAYKIYKEESIKLKNLAEKDPFFITATDTDVQYIGCGGTVFLHRHIIAEKPLIVDVQRRFRSFSDAHSDAVYHLPDVTYREDKPVDKMVTYPIVTPKHIPDGFYLYEPILTYKVNEHLTITRPAPSQLFYLQKEAHCYDQEKPN